MLLTNSTEPLWERACSRWGPVSRHQCWMSHRYREQARSHSFLCSTWNRAKNDLHLYW